MDYTTSHITKRRHVPTNFNRLTSTRQETFKPQ